MNKSSAVSITLTERTDLHTLSVLTQANIKNCKVDKFGSCLKFSHLVWVISYYYYIHDSFSLSRGIILIRGALNCE